MIFPDFKNMLRAAGYDCTDSQISKSLYSKTEIFDIEFDGYSVRVCLRPKVTKIAWSNSPKAQVKPPAEIGSVAFNGVGKTKVFRGEGCGVTALQQLPEIAEIIRVNTDKRLQQLAEAQALFRANVSAGIALEFKTKFSRTLPNTHVFLANTDIEIGYIHWHRDRCTYTHLMGWRGLRMHKGCVPVDRISGLNRRAVGSGVEVFRVDPKTNVLIGSNTLEALCTPGATIFVRKIHKGFSAPDGIPGYPEYAEYLQERSELIQYVEVTFP